MYYESPKKVSCAEQGQSGWERLLVPDGMAGNLRILDSLPTRQMRIVTRSIVRGRYAYSLFDRSSPSCPSAYPQYIPLLIENIGGKPHPYHPPFGKRSASFQYLQSTQTLHLISLSAMESWSLARRLCCQAGVPRTVARNRVKASREQTVLGCY